MMWGVKCLQMPGSCASAGVGRLVSCDANVRGLEPHPCPVGHLFFLKVEGLGGCRDQMWHHLSGDTNPSEHRAGRRSGPVGPWMEQMKWEVGET